jgi:hypothetical protein
MRRISLPLLAAVLVPLSIAGCGGGGDDDDDGDDVNPPDANTALNICGTAAGTISTYPGMFTGVTIGAGADLAVAEGACADERAWFDNVGDDQVVNLTGLRANETYVIELTTDDDLAFYVTTACDAAGPTSGSCMLYVDESFTNEIGDFVAPASGNVAVIVDAFENPMPPGTGAYTLSVREAECASNPDCTDPNRPVCDNFACVQCASLFDCMSPTAPVCDTAGMCVAGPAQCTGDDANEDDDGPAAATMIAAPTLVAPTVVTGGICNTPPAEADWYTFTTAAQGGIRVGLTFDTANPENDVDVYLLDAAGGLIRAGENLAGEDEEFIADLPAGDYYVLVRQFAPDNAAAISYTLTLGVPECVSSFQCLTAAAPVCSTGGTCGPGPADCTGDDAADAAPGDDGPAGGTLVAGTTQTFNRQLCAGPGESDFYRAVVTQGQGLTVSATFDGAEDFDVYALDATGAIVGFTFWLNPETVALTYLPAGTVYVQIVRFAPSGLAASAYSVTITKTTAQTCANAADCAAEYETQIYRGQCTAGACVFIPPGARANGAPCDDGPDCMSGSCSYNLFESDAQDSVCTTACAQTADCAGIGAGLTCTTGFQTNLCVPSCAADLECGALVGSSTPDPGLPWNYGTCTVASGVCSP